MSHVAGVGASLYADEHRGTQKILSKLTRRQSTGTTTPHRAGGFEKAVETVGGADLARLLPKSKTIVLPDAGHQMWLQDPEACRNEVEKFLANFGIH